MGYHEEFAASNTGAGAYVCQLLVTAPAFTLAAGGPAAPLAAAVRGWAGGPEVGPTPGLTSTPVVAPEYTLTEFTRTIWGADQVAPAVIEKLYGHFNDAKGAADPAPHWAAMEALVRGTSYTDKTSGLTKVLNDGWPPAKGGFNKRMVQPAPPDVFDRYQKKVRVSNGLPVLEGTFTSPLPPGGAFDYEARALEGQEKDYDLMYKIEVLQPFPFAGEESDIIPWHGHAGNGVQTRMLFPPEDPVTKSYPWSWADLEEKGYVKITYGHSPSGKFLVSPDGSTAIAQTI